MPKGRRRKIYGKAFPITREEARAYERVDRPRYRSNPIGVTRMSSVNGRGSYGSARQATVGKTPKERLSRARTVMRNGSMPGLLKNRKSRGESARRAAAKRAGTRTAKKRNVTRTTMKSNTRRKVSGTNYYRTSNGSFQDAKGKFVKSSTVKGAMTKNRKKTATKRKTAVKRNAPKRAVSKRKAAPKRKTAAPKRRIKRNAATVGASRKYSAGWDKMRRSKAGKKAAATRKRRQAAAARLAGRRGSVGGHSRLKLEDPRTGRTRRSYMYTTPAGKRRRISTRTIVKSGHKTPAEIRRGRSRAAAKIKREGSAFVANKKKSTARRKRAGKRLGAYRAAQMRGLSVKKAKAAALRAVPLMAGDRFKGSIKVGTLKKGQRKVIRVKTRKGKSQVKRKLVGNKRKAVRRRKKTVGRKRLKRNTIKRRTYPNKRRKAVAKRRSPVKRRRSSVKRRKLRRNKRRTYRRNQGFMTVFQKAFMSGIIVGVGFISHKVVTNLICDPIFDLFKKKETATTENGTTTAGIGQTNGEGFNLDNWKKPICGAGVLAIGIPLVNTVAKKQAVELGAGMVASWLHSLVVSASLATKQEKFISAVGAYNSPGGRAFPSRRDWTGRKWPYPSSRAAALGRRRRGVRGLGASHERSIMPRYAPIQAMNGAYQAAAGQYNQAAAGQYNQAAAGEYFTPMNATGEYFAPMSTQGVGSYEGAGKLAMPGNHQIVQDGIRPDSNLDREMSMMEAAAGVRGGTGSYFESSNNGRVVNNVPEKSQWVPNGQLWAGEMQVDASQKTSELSAGILNVPGGNGILSGG